MKELRLLADKKDPKHALAMVIWNEGNEASLDSAQNKVNISILKIFRCVGVILVSLLKLGHTNCADT